MSLVVGVLVLVTLHIARLVGQVLSAGNPLALSSFVKALLVRAGVLADVRQSVHGGGRFSSLENVSMIFSD